MQLELVHLTPPEYMKAAQFDIACFKNGDEHHKLKSWTPQMYRQFFGLEEHENPDYVNQLPLARACLAVNEYHEEVGFAAFYVNVEDDYRPEKTVTYLSRFGILPHQRRKGYGRQFFKMVCEYAAPAGNGYIYLHCPITNPNREFWTTIGCNYIGETAIDAEDYNAFEKYF